MAVASSGEHGEREVSEAQLPRASPLYGALLEDAAAAAGVPCATPDVDLLLVDVTGTGWLPRGPALEVEPCDRTLAPCDRTLALLELPETLFDAQGTTDSM